MSDSPHLRLGGVRYTRIERRSAAGIIATAVLNLSLDMVIVAVEVNVVH